MMDWHSYGLLAKTVIVVFWTFVASAVLGGCYLAIREDNAQFRFADQCRAEGHRVVYSGGGMEIYCYEVGSDTLVRKYP